MDKMTGLYTEEVKNEIINSCFTEEQDGFYFSAPFREELKRFRTESLLPGMQSLGNSPFIRTQIKNEQEKMEVDLNTLSRAFALQNKELAARAIYDLMVRDNTIKIYTTEKEYSHDNEQETPKEWSDIAKSEDPEIAEIGQDMQQLEESLCQSSDYVTQTCIEAKENVIDLAETMQIEEDISDPEKIKDIVEGLEGQNLSPENVVYLDELKSGNKDILAEMTSDDKDKIIMDLLDEIGKTENVTRAMSFDYIDKAAAAMSACKEKTNSLFTEISQNISNFATETAKKAGNNLLSAYDKASKFYETVANKARSLNKKINLKIDSVMEYMTGGLYSKVLDKAYQNVTMVNAYKDYQNGKIDFIINKDGKLQIPPKPTLIQRFDSHLTKMRFTPPHELRQAVWKGQQTPIDIIKQEYKNDIETAKEAVSFVKEEAGKVKKEIMDEAKKDLKPVIEKANTAKTDMILAAKSGYKDFISSAAIKQADLLEKTAARTMRRVEKYIETDKIVFKAKDDINRSLNSIAGINPMARGTYELSDDMNKKFEILKQMQEKQKEYREKGIYCKDLNNAIKDGLKEFKDLQKNIDRLNEAQIKAEQYSDRSQNLIKEAKNIAPERPKEVDQLLAQFKGDKTPMQGDDTAEQDNDTIELD